MVLEFLNNLTEDQIKLLAMTNLMTYEEIGQIEGVHKNTIYNKIKDIKKEYKKEVLLKESEDMQEYIAKAKYQIIEDYRGTKENKNLYGLANNAFDWKENLSKEAEITGLTFEEYYNVKLDQKVRAFRILDEDRKAKNVSEITIDSQKRFSIPLKQGIKGKESEVERYLNLVSSTNYYPYYELYYTQGLRDFIEIELTGLFNENQEGSVYVYQGEDKLIKKLSYMKKYYVNVKSIGDNKYEITFDRNDLLNSPYPHVEPEHITKVEIQKETLDFIKYNVCSNKKNKLCSQYLYNMFDKKLEKKLKQFGFKDNKTTIKKYFDFVKYLELIIEDKKDLEMTLLLLNKDLKNCSSVVRNFNCTI